MQRTDSQRTDSQSANLTPHDSLAREERWALIGQRPVIAWLTGLSGSGKSSIACAVEQSLARHGRRSMALDGDSLRLGLNADLGFSEADRAENVRRTAEVARLMAVAGLIVVVSLISPLRAQRAAARRIAGDLPFLEVYIDTPLEICEARDPKGLYRKARAGQIPAFTGISAPYEPPVDPDLILLTQRPTVEQSAEALTRALLDLSAAG